MIRLVFFTPLFVCLSQIGFAQERINVNFISNMNSTLSIDGQQQYRLTANLKRKIALMPGKHLITLNAIEPCTSYYEELFEVKSDSQTINGIEKNIFFSATSYNELVKTAIELSNLADLKKYINCGIDINKKTEEGITFLHFAANKGNLEMVRYLISIKAGVNAKSKVDDSTPLHSAVSSGRHDVVRLLLDNGAEVNAKTRPFGDTPYKLAIDYKQFKVAEILRLFGGKKE